MAKPYMTSKDVHSFISGKTVYAFDPNTGAFVATLVYCADGTIEARFADAKVDNGQYGFEGQLYWTRYENFRSGQKHAFHLQAVDDSTAQAFHDDGRKAFLLSHEKPEPKL